MEGNFVGPLYNTSSLFSWFGSAITSIGDVDNDGVDDIAVGMPELHEQSSNKGALWVLLLNSDGTLKSEHKISATHGGFTGVLSDGDRFGDAIAPLGDMDGNGVVDLAVGARRDDDGGTERGAVWILFLEKQLDGSGQVSSIEVLSHHKISDSSGDIAGELSNSDDFGIGIDLLGDIDNDARVAT